MNEIDFEYYDWLCGQIKIPQRNRNSYNDLFMIMHNVPFVWIVDRDDNRVGDANDLRREFLAGRDYEFSFAISVLEVMIALSRRMASNAEQHTADEWAWKFIENLRLKRSTDPLDGKKLEKVNKILENLIWRQYDPDGYGGFFPLVDPPDDQTKMELWDQMQLYSIEIMRGLRTD